MPEITLTMTMTMIAPLDTAGLDAIGIGSVFVRTFTESVAGLITPMVQPTSMTVTAVTAASAQPVAFNTINLFERWPHTIS